MVEDKIIDRIQRLWALSKSNNQFEAEAAAEKAQELMLKYNLDMSELGEKPEKYVQEFFKMKNRAHWAEDLMNVLGRANGCTLIIVYRDDATHCFVGRPSGIEVTFYSYQQMERKFKWLADVAWQVYLGNAGEHVYREGFYNGLNQSLQARLLKAKDRFLDANPNSRQLVVQENKDLDMWVRGFFPNLGNAGYRTMTYGEGYNQGKAAGRHLEVNAGLKNGGVGQRRLG